ncbi:MAG: anhydro-N-acetylmuramic acid kinase [Bacteroidota bacterium]|nr:anhydro-N-acetylmuramic acid kinase [Bacteroidota bacterium]
MNKFISLFAKNQKIVAGILSGTSVDAVDVALVRISGCGVNTRVSVIDFESYPISTKLKKFILKCSSKKKSNVEEICKLNFILGSLFASSIKKIVKKNNLKAGDIDLIGSHGQTIYHSPMNEKLFGFNSKSTLQVGEPSVIANQTGITVIGDFRKADLSAGGEGAPLVPYLDYILFRHKTLNRAYVNIGGISNVTYLKKSCKQEDVIAFDSGPGNMIIDYIMKKFLNRKFDDKGKIAASGKVNEDLFKYICSKDKFYKRAPPKSTGREYYGEKFVEEILKKFNNLNSNDIIATFTKYTAFTIRFVLKNCNYKVDELIVSGGGAKNLALMKFIKEYFKNVRVSVIKRSGINPDNKEAVLFAVLANELVSGNRANMTSVTGSNKNVFLGKICVA